VSGTAWSTGSALAFISARLLILPAIFGIMILTARAVGGTQPPPAAIKEFHLTDCALPCWLGITPGQTHTAEAFQRVSAAYPQIAPFVEDAQIASTFQVYLSAKFGWIVFEADSSGIIHRILLINANTEGIAIGDVITSVGTPSCIVRPNPLLIFYRFSRAAESVTNGAASAGSIAVNGGGDTRERWRQSLNNIDIRGPDWDLYGCPVS